MMLRSLKTSVATGIMLTQEDRNVTVAIAVLHNVPCEIDKMCFHNTDFQNEEIDFFVYLIYATIQNTNKKNTVTRNIVITEYFQSFINNVQRAIRSNQ